MSNDIFETPEFKEWFAELMQAAIHLATLSQKPIPRPDRAFADGSNAIVGERSEETLISDLRPPELPYTIVTGPPRPWFEGEREVFPHVAPLLTAIPDNWVKSETDGFQLMDGDKFGPESIWCFRFDSRSLDSPFPLPDIRWPEDPRAPKMPTA